MNNNTINNGQHIQNMLYVIKAIMLALDLKTLKVPKDFYGDLILILVFMKTL